MCMLVCLNLRCFCIVLVDIVNFGLRSKRYDGCFIYLLSNLFFEMSIAAYSLSKIVKVITCSLCFHSVGVLLTFIFSNTLVISCNTNSPPYLKSFKVLLSRFWRNRAYCLIHLPFQCWCYYSLFKYCIHLSSLILFTSTTLIVVFKTS